tara:strand:+ start:933 stop:1265 length:333 start_codon:yes stop_codon:yes gene_type:complete
LIKTASPPRQLTNDFAVRFAPGAWCALRIAAASTGFAPVSTKVARHDLRTIMACPPKLFAALPAGSCYDAGDQRTDISGAAVSFPNVDTLGPTRMESPSLKKRHGANEIK